MANLQNEKHFDLKSPLNKVESRFKFDIVITQKSNL